MCRISGDGVGVVVDNILILSYYVVNDLSRLEYILLKIMMIDNNITSRTLDNLNI